MSQYIVWFLIWLCVCLMPISYKKAKFGITEVKSNFSNLPEFFRSQRFVSVNGFILFPIASGIIWAVALGGWAIFQDFTFARWNGSILGLLSLSITFLFLGAVTRYISVIYIRNREPIDITDQFQYAGIRPFVVIAIVLLLSASNVTPLMGNLDFNPMFKDLNDSVDNTDAPVNYLTDPNEVRVISWYLATQYLERSYGDSASSLNANEWQMMDYTTPSLVNGEFVWINAPIFEAWKWTGGKEVPFYVTVVNDPANMSNEGFDPIKSSEEGFSVHVSQISWENRIDQILFDEYALDLVKVQVRFDIDDEQNPYWIIYLGKRGIVKDVVTMEKILIINARDINDHTAYDVEDPNIPAWLEIVYPDYYVEDWASLWGEWREGILYHSFTKTHLSFPSDSARFIVLNGQTYWYVPMTQLSSDVLAGYILVDTRSGEAVYHNRETKSLANLYTAEEQVYAYLSSGAEGFSQLRIDEGYLYPIMTDSGAVRDAYIFPLYSGFSIQKFAIVDAEEYTQTPVLETNLETALMKYNSRAWGDVQVNVTYDWVEWQLENGYCEEEECVVTANSTTYVITEDDLADGDINSGANEWRELKLAVSEFERTGNVTIFVTANADRVNDVDYEGSDLVERKQ
jgi:hypothetical protein